MAYNDLGVLYYNARNKEKAHQFYEKAVQLDPNNMVFSKESGRFFTTLKWVGSRTPLRIYVKILEVNPEDVETLLITGHICVALHKFEDARVFLSTGLGTRATGIKMRKRTLEKLSKMGPHLPELKSAEDMYQEIQPLLNNGDPHKAIASLEKLLESFPDFALAHNNLGRSSTIISAIKKRLSIIMNAPSN